VRSKVIEPVLLYGVKDGVATLTLNNHPQRNAMSRDMAEAFDQALVAAATDQTARVIVITGAGTAFCSGADISRLKETAAGGAPANRSVLAPSDFYNVFPEPIPLEYRTRYTFAMVIPKPVIAAVNGPAVGAGLLLALHCDIRFASTNAAFMAGFVRLGAAPEGGMAWTLPQMIGSGRARELMLSGRRVSAAEALSIGLVSRVIEPEGLMPETLAYARELATGLAPGSVAAIKRQLRNAPGQSFGMAYTESARDGRAAASSQDFLEGLAAVKDKRMPRFTGA
jgi:enoyl-CoA hydratase/carnithine racemase